MASAAESLKKALTAFRNKGSNVAQIAEKAIEQGAKGAVGQATQKIEQIVQNGAEIAGQDTLGSLKQFVKQIEENGAELIPKGARRRAALEAASVFDAGAGVKGSFNTLPEASQQELISRYIDKHTAAINEEYKTAKSALEHVEKAYANHQLTQERLDRIGSGVSAQQAAQNERAIDYARTRQQGRSTSNTTSASSSSAQSGTSQVKEDAFSWAEQGLPDNWNQPGPKVSPNPPVQATETSQSFMSKTEEAARQAERPRKPESSSNRRRNNDSRHRDYDPTPSLEKGDTYDYMHYTSTDAARESYSGGSTHEGHDISYDIPSGNADTHNSGGRGKLPEARTKGKGQSVKNWFLGRNADGSLKDNALLPQRMLYNHQTSRMRANQASNLRRTRLQETGQIGGLSGNPGNHSKPEPKLEDLYAHVWEGELGGQSRRIAAVEGDKGQFKLYNVGENDILTGEAKGLTTKDLTGFDPDNLSKTLVHQQLPQTSWFKDSAVAQSISTWTTEHPTMTKVGIGAGALLAYNAFTDD